MSQYTIIPRARLFPFDPYVIPHDLAVRASNALLQNERPRLLELVQRRGDTLEYTQRIVQEDNLKQISDLMHALEWLKHKNIFHEVDMLLNVKLWYTTNFLDAFCWRITGMVDGSTKGMHPFEIRFTDDEWNIEVGIWVDKKCIMTFKDEEDEEDEEH